MKYVTNQLFFAEKKKKTEDHFWAWIFDASWVDL